MANFEVKVATESRVSRYELIEGNIESGELDRLDPEKELSTYTSDVIPAGKQMLPLDVVRVWMYSHGTLQPLTASLNFRLFLALFA